MPVLAGRSARWTALLGVALLAAAAAYCAVLAYPTIFTGAAPYDDEGYLLASFRSWIASGGLYTTTYSQYGPGYYAVLGTLFRLTDANLLSFVPGRLTALTLLVATSAAGALTVWIATRRLLVAVAAQLFLLAYLEVPAAAEPLHPGGYLVLLLGVLAAICVAGRLRGGWRAPAAAGAVIALLGTTKINVGAFAAAGVVLAVGAGHASRRVRVASTLLLLAIPVVITARLRELEPFRLLASAVALGGAAALVTSRLGPRLRVERRSAVAFLGAAAAVAVLCTVPVLLTGTSPAQLLEGALLAPARFPGVFVLAPTGDAESTLVAVGVAVAFLGATLLARALVPESRVRRVTGLARLVGGALALYAVRVQPDGLPLLPLALVGASVVALPDGLPGDDAVLGRRVLLMIAVLQPLHAYPVAGSQWAWGSFLLAVIAHVNLGDGISELADLLTPRAIAARGFSAVTVACGVALALPLAASGRVSPAPRYDGYLALPAARAAGVGDVRVDPDVAARNATIAGVLRSSCDSFYSIPGLASFYVWAQLPAPTGRIATAWPMLFDDALQEDVVRDLARFDGRLCLLWNGDVLALWQQGRPLREGPLVTFLARFDQVVGAADGYVVLRRGDAR